MAGDGARARAKSGATARRRFGWQGLRVLEAHGSLSSEETSIPHGVAAEGSDGPRDSAERALLRRVRNGPRTGQTAAELTAGAAGGQGRSVNTAPSAASAIDGVALHFVMGHWREGRLGAVRMGLGARRDASGVAGASWSSCSASAADQPQLAGGGAPHSRAEGAGRWGATHTRARCLFLAAAIGVALVGEILARSGARRILRRVLLGPHGRPVRARRHEPHLDGGGSRADPCAEAPSARGATHTSAKRER